MLIVSEKKLSNLQLTAHKRLNFLQQLRNQLLDVFLFAYVFSLLEAYFYALSMFTSKNSPYKIRAFPKGERSWVLYVPSA